VTELAQMLGEVSRPPDLLKMLQTAVTMNIKMADF
jgi:hypothetical protein